jgi:hypothetical protein
MLEIVEDRVRWSLPDPAHRELAYAACARLGLRYSRL